MRFNFNINFRMLAILAAVGICIAIVGVVALVMIFDVRIFPNQERQAAVQEVVQEARPETVNLEGTVICYTKPDTSSKQKVVFNDGLETDIITTKTVDGIQWAKTEYGWVILAGGNMGENVFVEVVPGDTSELVEEEPEYDTPAIEYEARDVFIRAKLLNVRTAPGEDSPLATQLPKGTYTQAYEVTEVDGGKWVRLDQGWAYMKHVYFPGDTGNTTGYAVVRDNGAKVKSRILESGETLETLKAGDRVYFLEKLEMQNGDVWIYTENGWIKGDDIYIEGDNGLRPAHGVVVDETPLNVRRGPGTNFEILNSLPYGTEVHVIERINRGEFDWGYTGEGWIYMKNVSLEYDE